VLLMFLYRLGGPELFEPDEGRNAEKARAILLLSDWITPHENFHAVLDKPIFFYWLIALSYKLFGVSEWAARLPSALAAFGSLLVVYFFVRRWWGEWEARWSVLILATSAGFFAFSRIVIFDMTLTAFITLALWAFYQAAHESEPTAGWGTCALLYIALGAATLTKGLVGLVVPGMIIFFHLLLTNSWRVLGKIHLPAGAVLFLLVVTPWYVLAETHNPGYLRYYLWEEHFGRFVTTKFNRSNPWYYYLYVAPLGLLPWTFLLPATIKNFWRRRPDDKTLWLILWAALPILFFSLSKAKLPQYILPSFPALAILIGVSLPRALSEAQDRCRFGFSAGWAILSSLFIYSIAGVIRPEVLPEIVRGRFDSIVILFTASAAISLALAYLHGNRTLWAKLSPRYVFLTQCAGLLCFVVTLAEMMVLIAPARSAKEIAEKALPFLSPTTQMVSYDTYAEGLGFYLKTEKPVWVVTHSKKKSTFLGNFYAITGRPEPISPLGEGLLTFEEFRDIWHSSATPLVILVKEKNLRGLERLVGATLKKVAASDEYLIVMRP
ncbi:MAG TPA: glycosyltransferase family 39 protein, partial [Candidatus Binatia bacterium]|nr:glycosyltransferase family 39 protein [Candidatus Binatia bacterium]